MDIFFASLGWVLSIITTVYIARAFGRSWWWLLVALLLPFVSVLLITLVVMPESRKREQEEDSRMAVERAVRQKLAGDAQQSNTLHDKDQSGG